MLSFYRNQNLCGSVSDEHDKVTRCPFSVDKKTI